MSGTPGRVALTRRPWACFDLSQDQLAAQMGAHCRHQLQQERPDRGDSSTVADDGTTGTHRGVERSAERVPAWPGSPLPVSARRARRPDDRLAVDCSADVGATVAGPVRCVRRTRVRRWSRLTPKHQNDRFDHTKQGPRRAAIQTLGGQFFDMSDDVRTTQQVTAEYGPSGDGSVPPTVTRSPQCGTPAFSRQRT
jgi:hypothetical protein